MRNTRKDSASANNVLLSMDKSKPPTGKLH
jgi:hypothetical protein